MILIEHDRSPPRPIPATGWPAKTRPWMVVFLVALLGAAFLDASLARWASTAPPALVGFGTRVSSFGLSGYMLVVSGVLVLASVVARRRGVARLFGADAVDLGQRAAFFFLSVAGTGILAQVVKHLVGRARPKLFETFGAFHFDGPTMSPFSLASFPSGHATTAFAAAFALGLMVPRARAPLFAAAVAIAASRVLIGAHFASDVVAGAGLGAGVTFLVARAFARRSIAFDGPDPVRPIERRSPRWGEPGTDTAPF